MNTAFNILVVPSIILILAAMVTAVLRRASAALRHELWAIAIFGATFLPMVLVFAPKWEIPVIQRSGEIVVAAPARSQRDLTLGSGTTPTARAETPSQSAPPDSGGEFLLKRTLWLVLVWCAGAVAVFVRFVFGVLAVRRLVRHANAVDGGEWRPLLDELRSQLSIRRKVRVVVGTESFPPMTWGSVILLPAEAQHWNLDRRRLVLAHELAHVRRRDGLLQSIVQLSCAAHWFNPLIWLAAKRLRMERERACDDQVLNLGVDGHLYASHLVEVARVTRPRELSLATVSMAHPSQLETRIRAIMDSRTHRRPLSRFRIFVGYSSVATVLFLLATVRVTATTVPAPIFPPPLVAEIREPVVIPAVDPTGTGEYRLVAKSNPPAQSPAATWSGSWKLSKERSTVPQASGFSDRFRSIESFTISFEPVSGGVTVTTDLTFIPFGDLPGSSRRTKARTEFTVMFGEATDFRSIVPFVDLEGFVTFRPTSEGLEILSSTGTRGVRQVEIVTFSASDDGRTLTETVNTVPGVQGVFERQ
jgi:beta-lactamase regulating signal transducer with metallopeptidase domain